MKITKSQLKSLIKEEFAKLAEEDVPSSTTGALDAIKTKLRSYMERIDDINETIPFMLGVFDILLELNPNDFTDSEQKTTLMRLLSSFRDQIANIGKEQGSDPGDAGTIS